MSSFILYLNYMKAHMLRAKEPKVEHKLIYSRKQRPQVSFNEEKKDGGLSSFLTLGRNTFLFQFVQTKMEETHF